MADLNVIEQYTLRASFLANRLMDWGYIGLFERASELIERLDHKLDWNGDFVQPSETAKALASELKIPISKVFAHPSLLQASPHVLQYYRCVSGFPLKGIQRVSGVSDVKKKEFGSPLSEKQAHSLVNAINSHSNLLFTSAADFEAERLKAMVYASAGITIDGSWRNQIGAEGERATKKTILDRLLNMDEVDIFILKTGESISDNSKQSSLLMNEIDEIQSVQCINGSQIVFASEPDLRFVNPKGKTTAGIEVKAGLDPAGALERLGAMIKSFEELKSTSPEADTILLASCITEEVQSRLNETNFVTRSMDLSDILTNRRKAADKLVTQVRRYLGLLEV